jgi:hypothetical protein
MNEPCFDVNSRKEIVATLKKQAELNDKCIINLLCLMRDVRLIDETSSSLLCIIDPLVITLAYRRARVKVWVQSKLESTQHLVVLMPLHRLHHWSLLVFLPHLKQYIHFDSLAPLHQGGATSIRLFFDDQARYTPLPFTQLEQQQQDSHWECGLFLLMNAYVWIHACGDAQRVLLDEDSVRHFLDVHSPSIGERYRRLFTNKLLAILDSQYMEPQSETSKRDVD